MNPSNFVQLIGNLGDVPNLLSVNERTKVVNVPLATNERYKNERGETVESVTWHRLVCFNSTADLLHKFCNKGSRVLVTGKLRNRSYDREGVTVFVTEIIVSELVFLTPKKSDHGN